MKARGTSVRSSTVQEETETPVLEVLLGRCGWLWLAGARERTVVVKDKKNI